MKKEKKIEALLNKLQKEYPIVIGPDKKGCIRTVNEWGTLSRFNTNGVKI